MSSWKSRRVYIAGTALCVAAVSFAAFMLLFVGYYHSHPAQPNPALGLVYPLNNHGRYIYISAAESTGLALLGITLALGLIAAAIVVPKEGFKLPTFAPGESRWRALLNRGADIGPLGLTPPMKRFFLLVGVLYAALIYFVGPPIVRFAVSHGVVISLG